MYHCPNTMSCYCYTSRLLLTLISSLTMSIILIPAYTPKPHMLYLAFNVRRASKHTLTLPPLALLLVSHPDLVMSPRLSRLKPKRITIAGIVDYVSRIIFPFFNLMKVILSGCQNFVKKLEHQGLTHFFDADKDPSDLVPNSFEWKLQQDQQRYLWTVLIRVFKNPLGNFIHLSA